MNEFIQFLKDNWQPIASALLFILATIAAFIRAKKKGYSFTEILSGILLNELPTWISDAEGQKVDGDGKKVYVLNKALNFCAKQFGRPLTSEETDRIVCYVSEKIEAILSTPEKKGVKYSKRRF